MIYFRLDDAQPYMDSNKWAKVIQALQNHDVKTVIAVIPNVRDELIFSNNFDHNFWRKVKKWDKFGHKISMHGINHLIENKDDCWQTTWKRGEKLGGNEDEIFYNIRVGLTIFKNYKITVDSYVPPAHGISELEIKCLKKSGIQNIFDGFSFYSTMFCGVKIYPQFIWNIKDYRRRFETFICLHPCSMSENEIENLDYFLKNNRNLIASWDQFKHTENSLFKYKMANKLLKFLRRARNVLRR